MDLIYSDKPVLGGGETRAFIITGTKTHITLVHKAKGEGEKDALAAFQERVVQFGRPIQLMTDCAKIFGSKRFVCFLCDLWIQLWNSEPYHQNPNPIERRYQMVKRLSNGLMERTGAPGKVWLEAPILICFILRFTVHLALLGTQSPMMLLSRSHYDISTLLFFRFWEPIY